MKIKWQSGLPFMSVSLVVEGATVQIDNALIDTGAASSLFNIEKIFEHGFTIQDTDIVCEMVGIGGSEHVIQRKISSILVANRQVENPTVQFGKMDYGFSIDGIVGSDILRELSAVIDFDKDTITAQN
jgi:hypothetical protein